MEPIDVHEMTYCLHLIYDELFFTKEARVVLAKKSPYHTMEFWIAIGYLIAMARVEKERRPTEG